ncbi:MAG: HelD family protein [Clostridia bacterium]
MDTVSNDELLKPYLETGVDNRLKNIVSTIQSEQNAIIRESLFKNMIVQGVAGSGKTTVALHRIAYLVYNHRDSIKPEQYLVIGPNQFFVNYISGVLPDLDVNHVKQCTYEELCAEFIQEDLQLINEEEKLIASITKEDYLTYEKLKVSMKFKEALDTFIKQIDENLIPPIGLTLKGYELVPSKVIHEIYTSLDNDMIYDSIQRKVEKTKILLAKYIEDNQDSIMENIKKQYQAKTTGLLEEKIERENLIQTSIEKELKSNCSISLKKYFSTLIPHTRDLYVQFLKNLDKYISLEAHFIQLEQCYQNAENIKRKMVEFEDLSALLYLHCKMQGNREYSEYKQVVIDEAQDYGEFCFYVLKKILNRATFSIFGDLAQSIYQYRSIKDWKQVLDTTFEKNCEVKYLLKSYRTTVEIMNEASHITKYINLMPAQPVIRHGNPVNYISYKDEKSQIEEILEKIKEYKNKGYISIAIICKDEKEASFINKQLTKQNSQIKNVVDSETQYEGGVCTITSYLAKGLEFDGVIITDASEGRYHSNRKIDMKLLYVAMTRPLHELTLLYKDTTIVKPLQKEI